ncbi:hypothetical protein CAEBREN_01821 [Caenorhabditis brenneri]|uniref:Uncharacterized protein n=1 Tax=Caenorhabditis brenneri TaxID=135651 RepID=G0NQV5_CAEBE|nr:hypothetical protein CAEBREN_01821 [Caenorhabditis brenneri]
MLSLKDRNNLGLLPSNHQTLLRVEMPQKAVL